MGRKPLFEAGYDEPASAEKGEKQARFAYCLKKGRLIPLEKYERWCSRQNRLQGCKNLVFITLQDINRARRNNNVLVIER